MKLLLVLALYCLYSCNCHYYNPKKRQSGIPLLIIGKGYWSYLCDDTDDEVILSFHEKEKNYRLDNDSMGYGYTASISFDGKRTRPNILVGAGSEFEVGKCRFRVLKVFDPWTVDTLTNAATRSHLYLYNRLALQIISAPSRCVCANATLNKYDKKELDSDWVERIYATYWKIKKEEVGYKVGSPK